MTAEPRVARTHELAFAVVVLVVAAGFALVALHYWRRGLVVVGCGIGLAGVLRLALPPRHVGLLSVRTRPLDSVVLGALGAAVLVLAVIVPG